MADAEKHAAIRELRGRYQENALKIVQASGSTTRAARVASAPIAAARPRPPPDRLDPCTDARPTARPQLDAQKRQAEMALKRAAFTAAQLDEMPEGVRTYESVGKA
jgi:hypothetical protein